MTFPLPDTSSNPWAAYPGGIAPFGVTEPGQAAPPAVTPDPPISTTNQGQGSQGGVVGADGSITGSGVSVNTTPSGAALSSAYLAALKEYPQYAWMLNDPTLNITDPTTGKQTNILIVAAEQGWDQPTLDANLSGTAWFKNNSDSARSVQLLKTQDPAQYAQTLAQQETTVQQAASQWGVNLTTAQLNSLATQAMTFNWTTQQLNAAIASSATYQQPTQAASAAYSGSGNTPGGQGQLGGTMDQYMQLAKQNLVPLSPQSAYTWAVNTMAGNTNAQAYAAYIAQQAKALFPQFSNQIDQGMSIATLAQPYQQAAASLLGIDPNQINMADPKYLVALSGNGDTGNKPMSLTQWNTYLMANPSFGFTNSLQGKSQATNLANFLGTAMGRTAGTPASSAPEFARTA